MTTDNFTPHNGGKCPVSEGTLIDVQYRSGVVSLKIPALKYLAGKSCATEWRHSYCSYDIIGWRLAEPIANTTPIDELIKEFEQYDEMALAIKNARLKVAEQPKQENEPIGEVHELSHGWECYIWQKAIDDGLVKDGDFVYASPQNSADIIAKLEADKAELLEALNVLNTELDKWYQFNHLCGFITKIIERMKGTK